VFDGDVAAGVGNQGETSMMKDGGHGGESYSEEWHL
jgi:hypothetical protein